MSPAVIAELEVERDGGHPAAEDEAHTGEALSWLTRAQDAEDDGGFARGFSLLYDPYFGVRGWQPSYPETTGYIIPTLFLAADELDLPELSARALRAADWEIEIQLPSGAVQAGVMGQTSDPAVFNTGQCLLGFLSALLESGDDRYAHAALEAAGFLVDTMDPDGLWTRANSPYVHPHATLYNARAAWALAEAGKHFGKGVWLQAAQRALNAVVSLQHENGWLPRCCLTDPTRPLVHTLAYATRGLLDGGRVLESDRILEGGMKLARALARQVQADGFLAGRFLSDWSPAVEWSCLTGQAQMANVFIRLYQITGDREWLQTVDPMMTFLKRTQNRHSDEPGLRGGIKGSFPLEGEYGRFQTLSWATKFYLDALLRLRLLRRGAGDSEHLRHVLP